MARAADAAAAAAVKLEQLEVAERSARKVRKGKKAKYHGIDRAHKNYSPKSRDSSLRLNLLGMIYITRHDLKHA